MNFHIFFYCKEWFYKQKANYSLVPYNIVETAKCLISLEWLPVLISISAPLTQLQTGQFGGENNAFFPNGFNWKQISFYKSEPEDLCLPNPLIMFCDSATHWSKTQSFEKDALFNINNSLLTINSICSLKWWLIQSIILILFLRRLVQNQRQRGWGGGGGGDLKAAINGKGREAGQAEPKTLFICFSDARGVKLWKIKRKKKSGFDMSKQDCI